MSGNHGQSLDELLLPDANLNSNLVYFTAQQVLMPDTEY
jgi:hypothetical protein